MTPGQARAMYRRQLAAHGETVTLRRIGTPNVDKQVLARVVGYAPEELVGPVQQGDRKIIVLAEDVESSGFPVPFRAGNTGGDAVIAHGSAPLRMQEVDDSTRRIAGELIAYEIRARG